MIKYILFFVAVVCFLLNFMSRKILGILFNKEITDKQEIVLKGFLYVIVLACAIGILIFL